MQDYMYLVSVGGLFALLGLAWALSYNRWEIKLRPIVWGVGLQFVFGIIILRSDYWSLIGMALLAWLLVTYMLQGEMARCLSRSRAGGDETEAETETEAEIDSEPELVGQPQMSQSERAIGFVFTGVLIATVAMAARLLSIPNGLVLGGLAVAVIFLALNSRFGLAEKAQSWAAALVVVLGFTWVIGQRNLTGCDIMRMFSDKVTEFLSLSDYGAKFMFSGLADPAHPGFGFVFAFKVLPTIIFFGGFMGVLYHLGIIQKVVEAIAGFVRWTVGTSGAETLSCSANIFVGQTEAPLLVKPFLDKMTNSELLTIMVGGFATIAGGVLAAYIGMGIPAEHLIAASVMSAPAALVIGKIICPEKELSETAGVAKLPEIKVGGNVIEAATNGISDGFKLALNVCAMLIGFIALIALLDLGLNWLDGIVDGKWLGGEHIAYGSGGMSPVVGEFKGWFPGSLQTLFGTLLRPLAWLMGVPWNEAHLVGNLLGIKISLNELVAYGTLNDYINNESIALSPRAQIISTYALCGFANFSSIGIQIGGISAVAPGRKADLAKLGLKAMFGGALASWLTATIAGILIG